MKRFLSIHAQPFDAAAGVICSTGPGVLARWQEAELTVQQNPLPDDLVAYLKLPSTEKMLRPLHNFEFRIHLENGQVQLSHDPPPRPTRRISSITSFADFYNHDQKAAPLIRDHETDALDAADLFGPEGLVVRIHTLTMLKPGFHIDFSPALVRQHGRLAMLVAEPQAAQLTRKQLDIHYFGVLDSGKIRALGQGDRAIVREIPHSPYYTPNEIVYREGAWLGYYTMEQRNKSFQDRKTPNQKPSPGS